MSIKNSLIKNTSINLASYFYLLIASFFSISIILGNLGREKFGVYIFFASFISLSSVFDFGISTAAVRKLSMHNRSKEEELTTWRTSLSLFIAISICVSLIVMGILAYVTKTLPIFKEIDQTTINRSIIYLTLIVFINQINTHFLILPQAKQRFDIFNSKTLLVGTANTILSAIISGIYPRIDSILLIQLIFHFITLVCMILYSLQIFSQKSLVPKFDKKEGKDLIGFGLKSFVGTLSNQIDVQFSTYALGSLSSSSAITGFNIPQNIVLKASGVISQISQVVYPLSSSLMDKDHIKKLKRMVFIIEFVAMTVGILAIILSFSFGKEFLHWWLKDAVVVNMAYPVLKIMSIYFLLNALTPIPTVLLQSMGKPHVASFFAVFTTIINAVSMVILIPKFGVIGAAYSTLISSLITVPLILIVSLILFEKQIKISLSTTKAQQ